MQREGCHSEDHQTDLQLVSSNTHPSSTDKTQTPSERPKPTQTKLQEKMFDILA